ncbi:MAG TPA: DNRLRE domain-containing protein, partial [Verrucomicrobiae bacterium]
AVADTYVRDGVFADSNFGTDTALDVNGSFSSGSSRAAYLKFNVAALTNAQNVMLRLTPQRVDGNALLTYELAASDSWTETGATWNNQPGGYGNILTNRSGYTVGQPFRIDVTAAAKSQAGADGILSLRITEPNAQGVPISFASRESWLASAHPALEYQMAQPPGIPTNLIAVSGYNYRADLFWTAASGAVAYNVKRGASAGGSYSVIARDVSGTGYSDTSLTGTTTYYYIITAVNNIGESDPSVAVSVTTASNPKMEPLADSYVESSTASSNWGAATNLLVKNNVALATRNTYLMFDVHGLAGVASATLTLMPNRVDDSTVKMYYGLAPTNWTELGIIWNNQPGGLGIYFATNTVAAGVADVVDVTSVVKSQAGNGGLLSIEITQPTNSNNGLIQFCSREHPTNSWHPVLQYSFPPNTAPVLAAIGNKFISPGAALIITNTATDPDLPVQTLTYSLLAAPANASINPATGVLLWRPGMDQANTINPFTVNVADSGAPSMSATQSFTVTVGPWVQPLLAQPSSSVPGGRLTLHVDGATGPDYQVQASTDLVNWTAVFLTNAPAMPFVWTNNSTGAPLNLFRIVAGPPFP